MEDDLRPSQVTIVNVEGDDWAIEGDRDKVTFTDFEENVCLEVQWEQIFDAVMCFYSEEDESDQLEELEDDADLDGDETWKNGTDL